ncbi:hypothetical protein KAR91_61930 [Candidatus Pacearchaeota archaeon]|nr:hypothetical protein [Candidatus Pacearchaeota archaeon]
MVKKLQKCDKVTKKDRYRMILIKYLSDPELPFPIRSKYGDIIGTTRKTVYDNFTTTELKEIEIEAYTNRKESCVRQRANVLKSLYDRAIGYHHAKTHVSCYEGTVILTPFIERYPPDRAAAQEFLDRVEGKVKDVQDLNLNIKDRSFNLTFNNFNVDDKKDIDKK